MGVTRDAVNREFPHAPGGTNTGSRGNTGVTKRRQIHPMKTSLLTSTRVFILTASIALAPCLSRAASPPSELLEKGIYTEETKGDVDAAIAIYQQLISEAK